MKDIEKLAKKLNKTKQPKPKEPKRKTTEEWLAEGVKEGDGSMWGGKGYV